MAVRQTHRETHGSHGGDRVWDGGIEEDSRPKLVPGVMLTLSHEAAEAIMSFTEEVLDEEDPKRRAKKALATVAEAISEVAFANRRAHPHTGVLVTKLQATARGWLARRLARVLLLRGGCRRELDAASGAFQYVWTYRAASDAPVSVDGRRGHSGSSGGGDEGLFRSWYPPALLKNETLPTPRAALRRVEGEEKKRTARLALANDLLDEQRDQLNKRDTRAGRLLALAQVVKLVERATASLESAALTCFGNDRTPPSVSVKVLHPRGGEPGDGAREAVVSEIMSAWDLVDTKVRERAEAARIRAERAAASGKGMSPRKNSPGRDGRGGGGGGTRTPLPGSKRGKKEAQLSVPTTNDNLAEFEKRLLQDSLHEGAFTAVASLLQRKLVPVAIHEASRLGRNREAWEKKGTSPFGLGASPFVYWETLASKAHVAHILRGVLRPFLENADLLRAMFVDGDHPSTDGATSADARATRRPTTTGGNAGGIRERETVRGGEWSPPPSAAPHANPNSTTATAPSEAKKSEKGRSESEDVLAAGDSSIGSWGYQSSLSSIGCWKVDAWAAARRDGSVELGFDSAAFDVFVRPWEEEEEEDEGQAAAAAATAGKKRCSSAAVVTNVLPFRLADGLPRELGPLLFDKKLVASLSAEGDDVDRRPPSRDGERRRRAGEQAGTTVEQQEGPDSSPGSETLEEEETGDALWVRKKASNGAGPVLSHVHSVGGKVEVRIRGEPLDAETLAMAGVPQDMAALVVAAADVHTSTACASKRPGSASVGAPSGEKQGRRRQRAAAH
eukprot:g7648.t1